MIKQVGFRCREATRRIRVPLCVETFGRQVAHERLESRISKVTLFLIKEVPIETEVTCHFDQLLGNNVSFRIRIFIKGLSKRETGTKRRVKVDRADGFNTIAMGSVSVGGIRDVDNTELEVAGAPITGGGIIQRFRSAGCRRAMPRTPVVHVLPEIKDIVRKSIIIPEIPEK